MAMQYRGSVPSDPTTYQQGGTATVLGNTGSLVKTGILQWLEHDGLRSGTTYTTVKPSRWRVKHYLVRQVDLKHRQRNTMTITATAARQRPG